jgi:short-subunit dehydrogenase
MNLFINFQPGLFNEHNIMSTQNFKEKVAVITGSTRGIGKATAIALAKNGASVVINGRDPGKLTKTEHELRSLTENVLAVCADVSIPSQAKHLIDKTIERFGKVDIFINNAAVSMRGNFSELEPEVFKTVFDTNVMGVVNCTIPVLPYIKKSRGSIVFISSLAGIRGLPIQSAYCSSKMALRAIAESIRIEEKNSEIHVGLIFVGITENECEKKVFAADGSLMELNEISALKVHSLDSVAKAILTNLKKRRYRTTLTVVGKSLAIIQPIFPDLVERLLVFSVKKNLRRSV